MAKLIATMVILAAASISSTPLSAQEPKRKDAARPKPKITISKETTFITEPLDKDVNVDYVAALNRRCSQGVTPENNAVVPFLRAMGPKDINKKIRKQYFEALGIPELPEKGEYFVNLSEFLPLYKGPKQAEESIPEDETWENAADEQFDLSQKKPWSREHYPVVAAMLEHNAKPLATFIEGVSRPRYYNPLIPTDDRNTMTSVIGQPSVGYSRNLVRCLTARAMLRMHEGDVAGAVQDIMACDRWGRLNSQGPFLLDHLLGATYQRYASNLLVVLAQSGKLTADQTDAVFADLRRPPEAVPVVESLLFGERLFGLGCLLDIANNGSEWCKTDLGDDIPLDILSLFGLDEPQCKLARQLMDHHEVDWNDAFCHANEWYNRFAATYKAPTVANRHELFAVLGQELKKLADDAVADSAARDSADSRVASRARARQLTHLLMWSSMSAWEGGMNVENNRNTQRNLVILALILGRYRSEHGKYPKALTDLKPKYLAEIPTDEFSGDDLHYISDGDGYELYSVGINGRDDGGRNFLEEHNYQSNPEEDNLWDDIAIRTPKLLKTKRQKDETEY